VGESPLVLKGCIAAFNRYCSNSVVHVMSQYNQLVI
jgi:hypothetical protein